jgi:hypothetical protein
MAILGARGLEIINRDETQSGYDTPPSDELWSQLLAEVKANGGAALILLDEFLMWAHDAASPEAADSTRGPVWYERLKNFFQRLSQAVASAQRSCLVVSLLATEPTKVDEIGREILDRWREWIVCRKTEPNDLFGRYAVWALSDCQPSIWQVDMKCDLNHHSRTCLWDVSGDSFDGRMARNQHHGPLKSASPCTFAPAHPSCRS